MSPPYHIGHEPQLRAAREQPHLEYHRSASVRTANKTVKERIPVAKASFASTQLPEVLASSRTNCIHTGNQHTGTPDTLHTRLQKGAEQLVGAAYRCLPS